MTRNRNRANQGRLKNEQIKRGAPKAVPLRVGPPKRVLTARAPSRAVRPPARGAAEASLAPEQPKLDPIRQSQEAIKHAARLDSVLSGNGSTAEQDSGKAKVASPEGAIDLKLFKAVKHDFKHALEAIHRQAVLTQSSKPRKQEGQLKRLYSEFNQALAVGNKAKAEALAQSLLEMSGNLTGGCEQHDHKEKKELKKLVAARGNDQELLASSAAQLKATGELSKFSELIAACEACSQLLSQGQRNSVENQA